MRVLKDICIGVVLGLCIVGVTLFFIPGGADIYSGFFDTIASRVSSWTDENVELLNQINFTNLFADGEQVQSQEFTDSGITGENQDFSDTLYPYYAMLNADEQALYKQMVANAEAYETAFSPVVNVSMDSVETVFHAVFYDHPELFWLDTGYSYKYIEGGEVVEIDLKYNDCINDIENTRNMFDAAVNQIVLEAQSYSTDYAKEEFVHDTLIETITYNEYAVLNQSAYSALVNHETVCAGYARSFQLIMSKLGIPTYYVVGVSQEQDHAWNIVYVDGKYQNVDVTWDDNEFQTHRFFNVSDAQLSQTHTRTGISTYLPSCF